MALLVKMVSNNIDINDCNQNISLSFYCTSVLKTYIGHSRKTDGRYPHSRHM